VVAWFSKYVSRQDAKAPRNIATEDTESTEVSSQFAN
jgi:hypothetical protein